MIDGRKKEYEQIFNGNPIEFTKSGNFQYKLYAVLRLYKNVYYVLTITNNTYYEMYLL